MTAHYNDLLTSMGLELIVSEAPVPSIEYNRQASRSHTEEITVIDEELSVDEFESREELFEFIDLFIRISESNLGRQTREIEKAVSIWPKDKEIDPEDELVSWLTVEEKFIASFYKSLAVPPAEDTEASKMYEKMEKMFVKYLNAFQDLRCKILLHDGDASPRTGKVITSGKDLLKSFQDTK